MSQENVELLRRACEHAAKTGELPRDLCHPDLVWDTTTFGGFNAERCIGVDEANRWLARWIGPFIDWSIEVEEAIEAGDKVVAVSRQRGTPGHGGPQVELRLAQVWTFRDGLIARMKMYPDRAEALEAAGLSE